MCWKQVLRKLEKAEQWDDAIEFMRQIIQENPDDMDAYMCMNFLLMNLLMEEQYYDKTKEHYYETLIKWYFDESYAKFSDNPEYLYITGKTAVIAEWLFGIDVKDYEEMLNKALRLDPENLTYKEPYYWELSEKDPLNPLLISYANIMLSENSPVEKQLKGKGAVGEYLLGMKKCWAEDVLSIANKLRK